MLILTLIKQLVIGCILLYKYLLAPYIPSCCVFKLSCSDYTKLQIERYGLLGGLLRGTGRLLRCHPFAKINYEDGINQ